MTGNEKLAILTKIATPGNFLMTVLAFIFTIAFTIATSSIFAGSVVQDLWLWFIVPLGLAEISLPHAMGIISFFSFFTIGVAIALADKPDKEVEYGQLAKIWLRWFVGLFVISITWGWAAIIHSFM